jgi:hypothetical protein
MVMAGSVLQGEGFAVSFSNREGASSARAHAETVRMDILQFLESTLHHLCDKVVGLLRADSGFFDEAVLLALEGKRIPYLIAALADLSRCNERSTRPAAGGHWKPGWNWPNCVTVPPAGEPSDA